MKYFISSIPFFDENMIVHAYRMMTQDGNKLMGAAEDFRLEGGALQTPGLDTVAKTGIEPFAGDCDFFIEIGEYQLLMGMPLNMKLDPVKLVCVAHRNSMTDDAVIEKLKILKENGYRIAIDGLKEDSDLTTISEFFDFIILSVRSARFIDSLKAVYAHLESIKLAITDIPDMDSFKKFTNIKGVLLSGDFYKQPISKGKTKISPLKINSLNLLRQINEEDLDLQAAASIIERDPALSISLLRFINSMIPNRSREIDSIRQAVAILGQKEVKKWATIAISVGLGEDRPGEVTRLSLIRAKFAENLAPSFDLAVKSGMLFMSGLFSLIDIVLELPMEEAVEEIAIDDEVKDALLHNKGRFFSILSLIYAYEHSDWNNASILMVKNDVTIDDVTDAFINALLWYKQLLDTIDSEAEEENEEGE